MSSKCVRSITCWAVTDNAYCKALEHLTVVCIYIGFYFALTHRPISCKVVRLLCICVLRNSQHSALQLLYGDHMKLALKEGHMYKMWICRSFYVCMPCVVLGLLALMNQCHMTSIPNILGSCGSGVCLGGGRDFLWNISSLKILAGLSSCDEAVSDLLTSFVPKHIYKEVRYAHLVPHSKPHNQCPEGVSFGDDADVPAIGYCCTHMYIRTYVRTYFCFLLQKIATTSKTDKLTVALQHPLPFASVHAA